MDHGGFKTTLQQKGYRVTAQRLAVLQSVSQGSEKHLTADEIYSEVKKAVPGIGIATIYKTLRMLEQEGLINKLEFPDKVGRYEMRDDECVHCHLVCLACGRITELKETNVASLSEHLKSKLPFPVIKGNLMLYGYCPQCAGKGGKSK